MNFFQRLLHSYTQLMQGRYGVIDGFNIFLLAVYLVTAILTGFMSVPVFKLIQLLLLAYVIFRCMSKNISGRRGENEKFLAFWSKFSGSFKKIKMRLTDKEHIYFTCPGCGATLRVPRSAGHKKIRLHCRSCGNSFVKKA